MVQSHRWLPVQAVRFMKSYYLRMKWYTHSPSNNSLWKRKNGLWSISGALMNISPWMNIKLPVKHIKYCIGTNIVVFVLHVACLRNTPIMKKCPSCAYEIYPPISTAIIVLIRRGEEILLVHAHNFRGTFYGLVAGFLEVGETLEQCVQREVMEETGLRVKNITYFGNQPWPYPSGLMVGFIADYESGEIKLQKDELSAGAFYSKENMPEIPRKLSIARKMIDWWLSNN